MTPAEEKVWAEWQRFKAALPELIKRYPERWVVFRDGSVHGDGYADEESAYEAGVETFGPDGCFVVGQVTHKQTVILFAP